MNSAEIQLVQITFEKVRPHVLTTAEMFYQRLFTLDPSLRSLFTGDMDQQNRMLIAMLGAAVDGLDNLQAISPVLLQLGARHLYYRVEEKHYATVGSALLWTLGCRLGDEFTPAAHDAWAAAYATLSAVMMQGAIEAQKAKNSL